MLGLFRITKASKQIKYVINILHYTIHFSQKYAISNYEQKEQQLKTEVLDLRMINSLVDVREMLINGTEYFDLCVKVNLIKPLQ